jgi:hypothetical protein
MEAWTVCLERFKYESSVEVKNNVSMEEKRTVIRAHGGQGLKVCSRKHVQPVIRGEQVVDFGHFGVCWSLHQVNVFPLRSNGAINRLSMVVLNLLSMGMLRRPLFLSLA